MYAIRSYYEIGDHNQNQKGPFPYPYHQNIPMIVANHPDLKNGDRCDALVSNLDIAATCLEIANDTVPLGLSRSMSKMVNDKSFQREVNFAEFCDSYKIVITSYSIHYTKLYEIAAPHAYPFQKLQQNNSSYNFV